MSTHNEGVLALGNLLDLACGTPDDFAEWYKHHEAVAAQNAKDENLDYQPPYRGFMRYEFSNHCQKIVIIAKKRRDGSYEIKEFHTIEH